MSCRRRIHEAVLELLERRHGVGSREASWPAWMEVRLDRALDALIADGNDADAVIRMLLVEPERLAELADLLRVGETSFFRDPPQWEALRRVVLPKMVGQGRVRAVSVGCSTGEEAWSLAMLLDAASQSENGLLGFRVVAMDRSEVALATAREGLYPVEAARTVPRDLAKRYLQRDGETVRVTRHLHGAVSFVPRDAMNGPPPGSYEIVVCKNLLIYFGHEAGTHLVELLRRSLTPGGVLLVARSEVPRVRAMGHDPEEIGDGVKVFRG